MPSEETKKWHDIHARNIQKRERTRELRILKRKLGEIRIQQKAARRKNLTVPATLSLSENYEETVNFINWIHEAVFLKEDFIILDFSKCTDITSETCVVLGAEIDRCLKLVPKSVTGTYPTNEKVYFMLNELGFFSMLGVRATRPIFKNHPDIDVVQLTTGIDNPVSLMKGMKNLILEKNETIFAGGEFKTPYAQKIYRALTEAMANAVEHAYPENFKEENKTTCIPYWWRAGFKKNDTNSVVLVLYDQGAGIPNTLNSTWPERLEELWSSLKREPYDDEKLASAMEKGRSRTQITGRGQGSFDMQKLIRESTNAELNILSYRGKYVFKNSGEWEKYSVQTALRGTLIIWKICLNSLNSQMS